MDIMDYSGTGEYHPSLSISNQRVHPNVSELLPCAPAFHLLSVNFSLLRSEEIVIPHQLPRRWSRRLTARCWLSLQFRRYTQPQNKDRNANEILYERFFRVYMAECVISLECTKYTGLYWSSEEELTVWCISRSKTWCTWFLRVCMYDLLCG